MMMGNCSPQKDGDHHRSTKTLMRLPLSVWSIRERQIEKRRKKSRVKKGDDKTTRMTVSFYSVCCNNMMSFSVCNFIEL